MSDDFYLSLDEINEDEIVIGDEDEGRYEILTPFLVFIPCSDSLRKVLI
jgi:hypothetical protein